MSIILNSFKWILDNLVLVVGDYGVAIVCLTLIVRIILLPFSIKQKKDLIKQQEVTNKINSIKEKYKNDSKTLEGELAKYQGEYLKSFGGCLLLIIQAPIMMSLYGVIRSIATNNGTVLVPWVSNISLSDPYFILPIIYMILMILSTAFDYLYDKPKNNVSSIKNVLIMNLIFSLIISIKLPVGLAIYLITFAAFSFGENLLYKIATKK